MDLILIPAFPILFYLLIGVRVWFLHGLMELELYGKLNFNAEGTKWFLLAVAAWPGMLIGILDDRYVRGKGK